MRLRPSTIARVVVAILAAGGWPICLRSRARWRRTIAVLRQRADAHAGDEFTSGELVDLHVEQGHVRELQQRADAQYRVAARGLVDLVVEQGRIDDLEMRSNADSRSDSLFELDGGLGRPPGSSKT
jgi:hypothetical protein